MCEVKEYSSIHASALITNFYEVQCSQQFPYTTVLLQEYRKKINFPSPPCLDFCVVT